MTTRMFASLTLAALAFTGSAYADKRIAERLPTTADGVVEVSNVAGSIELVGWRRNEVEVEGAFGDGVERVEFTSERGVTRVRVHLIRQDDRRGGTKSDGEARLVIRVPQASRLRVSTVSASVRGIGLDGPIELRSVSGDVTAAGSYTEADLQSVSGVVQVHSSGRNARITVGSISGLVQIDGMNGELTGNTVSGTVRVTSPDIRRASLKSVSGDVIFEGPLADNGIYEIEAISGTARLMIEGRVDARFELHTFNGSIRNAFGPEPERTSRYAPGQALSFAEGQGGAQVSMRSISGTLHLSKK